MSLTYCYLLCCLQFCLTLAESVKESLVVTELSLVSKV